MAVATQKKTKQGSNTSTSQKKTAKKVKSLPKVFRDKQTRADVLQTIAEELNMTKTQVEKVFISFKAVVDKHLHKQGSGQVNVPHLGIKIQRKKKKASKARSMKSPLTGAVVDIPAKPARFVVSVKALKTLKDSVEAKLNLM